MDISKELLVSLIAAITALVVSIFNLITNTRSAREQRNTQISVEKMKDEILKDNERRQKKANFMTEKIDFFSVEIETAQIIRDCIIRLVETRADKARLENILNELNSAVNQMFVQYQKHGATDVTEYRKIMHEAKNAVRPLETFLSELSEHDTEESKSSFIQDKKGALLKIRGELKTMQEALAKARIIEIKKFQDI